MHKDHNIIITNIMIINIWEDYVLRTFFEVCELMCGHNDSDSGYTDGWVPFGINIYNINISYTNSYFVNVLGLFSVSLSRNITVLLFHELNIICDECEKSLDSFFSFFLIVMAYGAHNARQYTNRQKRTHSFSNKTNTAHTANTRQQTNTFWGFTFLGIDDYYRNRN